MKRLTCIIGAGFSCVAGVPLTKDLFEAEVDIYSEAASKKIDAVRDSYSEWKNFNTSTNAEIYLSELYLGKLLYTPLYVPFEWASLMVAMVLATPSDRNPAQHYRSPRYFDRLTYPTYCQEHIAFWRTIMNFHGNFSVVTTNYDLLIERSLRHKVFKRSFGVGFHYGGFKQPQFLYGQGSQRYNVPKMLEVRGDIPLYKLHGSLSWAHEADGLRLYQDMRPAYRKYGAAIVPPIQEKLMPNWLSQVWLEAKQKLKDSQIWVVCGYSLPPYDIASQKMLLESSCLVETIYILDPYSKSLIERWTHIAPQSNVIPLSGLPEGITELKDMFELDNSERSK